MSYALFLLRNYHTPSLMSEKQSDSGQKHYFLFTFYKNFFNYSIFFVNLQQNNHWYMSSNQQNMMLIID